jgi:SARP family transcriptional regulator, regulator of embCAB operon
MDEPRLRIYLAGNMALERGSALIPEHAFPGSQGRLAFAFLVAERSNSISKERLADALWDGEPPVAWGAALRAIVSKLRRVLDETGAACSIAHVGGSYQLRLPPDTWVDVEAAVAAAHDAEVALRDGDLPTTTGSALVAISIARRPFLDGIQTGWVTGQRAKLHDIQVRALWCRAQSAFARGDRSNAIGDAERVIELEPFREQAYVLLMRVHVDSGNNAEALATYGRLRSTLATELGADPSPTTEAAYLDVLRAT